MKETIIKQGIIQRVTNKLKDSMIVVGGSKTWRKRKYHLKYTQEIVDVVIRAFLDTLVEIIEDGDTAKLKGYFIIEPKYCKEKRAYNMIEDKEIMMPAQYRARVTVGKKLEDACKRLSELEDERSDENI